MTWRTAVMTGLALLVAVSVFAQGGALPAEPSWFDLLTKLSTPAAGAWLTFWVLRAGYQQKWVYGPMFADLKQSHDRRADQCDALTKQNGLLIEQVRALTEMLQKGTRA